MKMLLRRFLGGLVVLWLVSVLAFLLVYLVPGDAADVAAGENASPEQVAEIRAQLGLDRPILAQYLTWTGDLLTGDLGNSLFSGTPVLELMLHVAPVTLSLTAVALTVAVLLGVSLGSLAASRRGSWLDGVVTSFSILGIAMPSFWVAILLISIFAITLGWFPATGYVPISEGIVPWAGHVLLPGIALGLASAGVVARQTRGAVIDVLERPFVQSARARGASGWWLVRRHVLRNAAIPVVTILGLQTGNLLGGAIVVETVAGVNGLGALAVTAISRQDFPIIQAYVFVSAVVVVVVNLAVDVTYGWINPKVRS